MNEDLTINGIQLCVNKAGNQRKLASILETVPSTVNTWIKRDKKMPLLMAIKAEKMLGIPRDVIRPDIEW